MTAQAAAKEAAPAAAGNEAVLKAAANKETALKAVANKEAALKASDSAAEKSTHDSTEQKAGEEKAGERKKSFANLFNNRNSEAARANRRGFHVLYRKELADHLTSYRFWILFALLILVGTASVRGAMNTLSEAAQKATEANQSLTEYMFLLLYTTAGSSIYSFSTFLSLLGSVIGILFGFNAIRSEEAQGTLNRLAAQPIYRDTIINAKFLAGATAVCVIVFAVGGWLTGIGLLISGISPKPEEFVRVFVYLVITVIYICTWLAIAIFFSVVTKHSATSVMICLALWLFLTLFLPLVAKGFANMVYPLTGSNATVLQQINNMNAQAGFSRISPAYLFGEVTSILMNPTLHSLDIMATLQSAESQVTSYLPIGQSLLQIWPQIVAMFAEMVFVFAIAYICFMKQEIRA